MTEKQAILFYCNNQNPYGTLIEKLDQTYAIYLSHDIDNALYYLSEDPIIAIIDQSLILQMEFLQMVRQSKENTLSDNNLFDPITIICTYKTIDAKIKLQNQRVNFLVPEIESKNDILMLSTINQAVGQIQYQRNVRNVSDRFKNLFEIDVSGSGRTQAILHVLLETAEKVAQSFSSLEKELIDKEVELNMTQNKVEAAFQTIEESMLDQPEKEIWGLLNQTNITDKLIVERIKNTFQLHPSTIYRKIKKVKKWLNI